MSQAAHFCLCLLIVWETTVFWGLGSNALPTFDNDAFTIQLSGTKQCISANAPEQITLAPCNPDGKSQLWKWGSGERLFHVATTKCLALTFPSKKLGLVDCDFGPMMWWKCTNNLVYTSAQMGLSATSDGNVIVKMEFNETWVLGGSQDNICQKSYHIVHTTDGNSAGAPCEFPFKYKKLWYHECLSDSSNQSTFWCSTSSDYDRDLKRGTCLIPEEGCQTLFEGPEESSCYEFVPSAAVTWQQALDSCRSQGGDLFSITKPGDLHSKTLLNGLGRMPERIWIGLHQLDPSQGWQWSDGSPLSHIHWETGMPPAFTILDSDCGVLNSQQRYEVESCDARLPYICKKPFNASKTAPEVPLVYNETSCPDGWVPWSGWCYKLVKDTPKSFTEALIHCNNTEGGASLATFHSIDSKEMISTKFHSSDQSQINVWIGLISSGTSPVVFKWLNQDPITFTYWDKNQPTQPAQDISCIYYSGKTLKWRLGDCNEKLPFMCQKKGKVNNLAEQDECPFKDGWRRHGNSCYRLDAKQVPFENHCNFTIRNSFEQDFVSRLLAEQISLENQFFWIALNDVNNSGEYQWMTPGNPEVTYTNWAPNEPGADGGCVVMSTGKPLGSWRVKDCAFFKAGTICRRDLGPAPEPEPEPDDSAQCPSGWTSKPNIRNCYKVFHEERLSQKRSWAEAENFCQALGANLASFAHLAEMRALHSIMRETISDNRFFWVGLNRRNPATRSWQWSNGRPVSLDILHQDFHVNDPYSRDCTAFKTMKSNLKHLFVFLLHDVKPIPFYVTPFHCDAKLEWVCQIPRGKTLKTPEWYNPEGHHETSIFIDKDEFWFVTEPRLTFEEAKLYCKEKNSTLASPPSFTAARQIHQKLHEDLLGQPTRQKWWIDMQDPHHLYPMTYSGLFFYNSRFLGRCSSINGENVFPEYDVSCRTRLPFVCQKVNVTSVEKNPYKPQPLGLPCENSLSFRNKCYIEMKNPKPRSFKSAVEECQSVRGTMLTITDQVEQDFITSILATRTDMNFTWLGLRLRPNQQKWVDDSSVSFVNFNPLLHGMVKPITINQFDAESMDLCAFMYNNPHSDLMGSWDFTSCGDSQPLAYCQHYADKMEEPQVPSKSFNIGNHTVLLLLQNLTWFEALEKCNENEMELASISDAILQSSLVVHVNRARTPMWIGLFSEDKGVHYRWTDHSHTVFSRWAPDANGGSCVYIDTDGLWKTMECEEKLGGAVCHKPHDTISTPDDVAVKCPHKINGANWIPFKNNCYSLQLVSSRWEQFDKGQARETCKNLHEDATVLTIRDAEENEFIKQQLAPFRSLVQFIWLGMFKDDNDDQMKWFDGTNVQYNNWKFGRVDVDKPFLAGLNTFGVWFFITNRNYFQEFKQKMIVACKLDKDEKKKYNTSVIDFQRYGNLTYQVLPQKLTWFQALEECGRRGGHLASVHDLQHDAHINLIAKTDGFPLWIGLSSQDTGGTDFEWSDGTPRNYTPTITEPQSTSSSPGPEARCVYVTPDGKWVKSSCQTVTEGAICYTTNMTTTSQRARLQAAPASNRCPQKDGGSLWVQHEEHCYAFDMSFYNYSVFNMENAKSICNSLDAELLTIKSREENDFVTKHISDDPLVTSRTWLGINPSTENKPLSWHDGTTLEYSNWKNEALAKAAGPNQCAILSTADEGTWKLVHCETIRSRVVCQTKASKGTPVAAVFFILILVLLLLAVGFVVYKKKRHHFSTTVRYKRTYDQTDSTSIVTDPE
ncbi:lymphocyte antigen 75 isoform X2 [Boleophthalmus pectinirostris]|uniref:lymphocyte antigen 75 isoform X2 n=1 Tax=Boleophthalmus pectinirostris TaxID=150288 RepID=UPI00242F43CD|nr:lymphocyte antigen 75 isoform X2 [Boleophthalmus pectinirostris]